LRSKRREEKANAGIGHCVGSGVEAFVGREASGKSMSNQLPKGSRFFASPMVGGMKKKGKGLPRGKLKMELTAVRGACY